jgi:hypothetical protein
LTPSDPSQVRRRRPCAQLQRKADRMGAKMLGYDYQKGEWTIEVPHF